MTDLERFLELYKSFGIELEVETVSGDDIYFPITEGKKPLLNTYKTLTLEPSSHYSKLLLGYSSLYSLIVFTENGDFIEQGFWE